MGSSTEFFLVILIGAVLLLGPLVALVLAIVAFARSRKINELTRRVSELEASLRNTSKSAIAPPSISSEPLASDEKLATVEVVEAAIVAEAVEPTRSATSTREPASPSQHSVLPSPAKPAGEEAFAWETFVGQKAFGWLAVVLFIFAATFFLRYAYQNDWVGPVGRVTISELVGVGLVGLGWWYFRNGWVRFSNMLTSVGIVVLYLATFSAFGFYRLLPQQHAGLFLGLLVVESMVAAVFYRSATIAFVAVIGGLMTPILLQADHDSYTAFFIYLAVLNAGVVLALLLRTWLAVGLVSLLGTQGLYWSWYSGNYHPEKLGWALGFQAVLFGLYLLHTVVSVRTNARRADWEQLVRLVLNAVLFFFCARILVREDYGLWLGSAAICLATLYAIVSRMILAWRPGDQRLLLTALAISVGFIAWAIPIQADARWVAVGWAAMAATLWWFGLRIAAPLSRWMAGGLAVAAVTRLLLFDLPRYTRDPFVPIFNGFAIPSLGVAACILLGVVLADRFLKRLPAVERFFIAAAGVTGVLLVWIILSYECYGYFDSQALGTSDYAVWQWRGQLALTVMWTMFATLLLVSGFRLARPRLRWLGMALYGVSVVKLFLVDMANVQQIYRILAFFVLAVVLGLVARAYQRFK